MRSRASRKPTVPGRDAARTASRDPATGSAGTRGGNNLTAKDSPREKRKEE